MRRTLPVILLALLATAPTVASAAPAPEQTYIVTFRAGTDARREATRLRAAGHTVRHTYTNVFRGVAVDLPQAAFDALRRNPTVTRIVAAATVNKVTTAGTGSPNRLLSTLAPSTSATAPSAPTNVVAKAGRRAASLTWTKGADGGSALTGQTVRVYANGTFVGSVAVSAAATSVSVSGLTGGIPYRFGVTATNAIGTSPESALSAAVTPAK